MKGELGNEAGYTTVYSRGSGKGGRPCLQGKRKGIRPCPVDYINCHNRYRLLWKEEEKDTEQRKSRRWLDTSVSRSSSSSSDNNEPICSDVHPITTQTARHDVSERTDVLVPE